MEKKPTVPPDPSETALASEELTSPYGKLESVCRGLGRTTMIGRVDNSRIVSAEGLRVAQLMEANRLRHLLEPGSQSAVA